MRKKSTYLVTMKQRITAIAIVCTLLISFKFNGEEKARLNHIAVYVSDLSKSTAFYQHIIGLDTIPEPFKDGKHAWFKMTDRSQLHLIAGTVTNNEFNKNEHLCFSVPSIKDMIAALNKKNVHYENWVGQPLQITKRVDGVQQIYFKDPDGHWIEVNDDIK